MTEPRDLHCARCDARIELRHYDYPQHVRDHIPVVEAAAGPLTPKEYERLTTFTSDDWAAKREAEAAAGPRDAREWAEVVDVWRERALKAEASAGPRDEGLDVERLAQAMREHIASIRKDNDNSPCVEQCARDIARRYEAAAGDEGLREALVRAHEDIVTMYARHEPGWDVVHDWHADPGDIFKARAAFAAIFAKASE